MSPTKALKTTLKGIYNLYYLTQSNSKVIKNGLNLTTLLKHYKELPFYSFF